MNILHILEDAQKIDNIDVLRSSIQTLKQNCANYSVGNNVSQQYVLRQLDKIINSQTSERAQYYINQLKKAITTIRTGKVNDINLNTWQEYDDVLTDSLWVINRRDNSGVHSAEYWGNFIPQIPNQLLKRYTKKGDWVIDTFLGCGTTLIECQRLGRNGIGIELQESVAAKARDLIQQEPNKHNVTLDVVQGDSLAIDYNLLLEKHKVKNAQFLILHPPYHDIIKFSDDPRDLSNTKSVNAFLETFTSIVQKAAAVLEKGRYFAIIIGDKYCGSEWIPLGFLTMNEMQKSGFLLKSIVVKNFEDTFGKRSQKELWRYRALAGGYYVFKNEYMFIFRK